MRCLECGYRLLGLQGPACPECGRAFDLSDASSFAPEPSFWPHARGACIALTLLLLPTYAFIPTDFGHVDAPLIVFWFVAFFAVFQFPDGTMIALPLLMCECTGIYMLLQVYGLAHTRSKMRSFVVLNASLVLYWLIVWGAVNHWSGATLIQSTPFLGIVGLSAVLIVGNWKYVRRLRVEH